MIGFLNPTSPSQLAPYLAAFRRGLSEAGWVEGQNVAIEFRWAEGYSDRLPRLAADLVRHGVDLIASTGDFAPLPAAKNATSTIPIVFLIGGDPVALDLVASLARPAGNLTGFTLLGGELTSKWFELLSQLAPQANVVAQLINPYSPGIGDVLEAANAKQVQIQILKAGTESEIDAAFDSLARLHARALLIGGAPFFDSRIEQLATLAARYAVPAIYPERTFPAAGGLISYGASRTAGYRQVGAYVGRILNGARPADLPVQQPTTFELVVNLKTAKALGLTVPPSILARADEVIE